MRLPGYRVYVDVSVAYELVPLPNLLSKHREPFAKQLHPPKCWATMPTITQSRLRFLPTELTRLQIGALTSISLDSSPTF